MANDRPFVSTHWETETEVETPQGRQIVRHGVETKPLSQSYIAHMRATYRLGKRRGVRMAAGLVALLAIGSLMVGWLVSIAPGVVGLVLAGSLGALVAWWARRPVTMPTRWVYFRRYGPFRTARRSDEDEPTHYYLEVAGHEIDLGDGRKGEALYKVVAAIEWGEVYHTDADSILEVRDREGKVVYQADITGWQEDEDTGPSAADGWAARDSER